MSGMTPSITLTHRQSAFAGCYEIVLEATNPWWHTPRTTTALLNGAELDLLRSYLEDPASLTLADLRAARCNRELHRLIRWTIQEETVLFLLNGMPTVETIYDV